VFVVVGLGNPSSEYEETRHNIGFVVVDETAKELGIKFHKENSDYLIGIKNYRNQLIALVKPLTYMNNSGIAVKNIIEQYKLPLENLLVVVDDFNIPIGTIRIRRSGSSGGHNGLESIIYHLQTEDFPRLRCGIGSESMPKNKQELANFVLSPFTKSEKEIVKKQVLKARDAVICAYEKGLETAIQQFNKLKQ